MPLRNQSRKGGCANAGSDRLILMTKQKGNAKKSTSQNNGMAGTSNLLRDDVAMFGIPAQRNFIIAAQGLAGGKFHAQAVFRFNMTD